MVDSALLEAAEGPVGLRRCCTRTSRGWYLLPLHTRFQWLGWVRSGGFNDGEDPKEQSVPFKYRFNRQSPKEGEMEDCHTQFHSVEYGRKNILISQFTFNALIPLTITRTFNRFPFNVFHAEATIELSSRTDVSDKNLLFRPSLVVNVLDRRNNVSIQKSKEILEKKCRGKNPSEDDIRLAAKTTMDGSDTYGMISLYPSVDFDLDLDLDKKRTENSREELQHCRKIRVGFYLHEEAVPKFIRTQLPLILIAALNSINYRLGRIDAMEPADGSVVDSSDRYLQTSATLALTAVFLLPEIARRGNGNYKITWNELSVLGIFGSLMLSSVPPSFEGILQKRGFITPLIGVSLLWFCIAIPFINLFLYKRALRKTRWQQLEVINQTLRGQTKHPFL